MGSNMFGLITVVVLIAGVLAALTGLRGRSGVNPLRPMGLVAGLALAALLLGALVLAVTGLGTRALLGHSLSAYTLMLHAAVSGFFAVGLAGVAVLWASRLGWMCSGDAAPAGVGLRLSFWLLVLTGLLTALSMALAMLPLLGTGAQELLIVIHRYSALGAIACLLWFGGNLLGGNKPAA